VLHSAALRRLAAKTQVVGVGVDDFPRTRLTHSLECAQIGRELGGTLGADPDVVDAACLAHDLGHPPFGHNGELALDELARACGGFEGNAQSLRILTRLEAKLNHADGRPAGLNLTRATLDATVKYPWFRREGSRKFGAYGEDAAAFGWLRDGAPDGQVSFEAAVMDWADDVAYSVHDLEDGVHAGHVQPAALADPAELAVLGRVAAEQYSEREPAELAELLGGLAAQEWWPVGYDGTARAQAALKRATSELIGRLVGAAAEATRAGGAGPRRRYAGRLVVPERARAECAALKAVTYHYVMSRSGVRAEQERERTLVAELADWLTRRAPECLQPAFAEAYTDAPDESTRLRVVVDQVASLTDTSLRAWHRRACR
jgi:dGTPase